LDGAGEGQIFLRNLATGVVGTKPKGDCIPIIVNFGVMVELLGHGPDLIHEGQGGFEIL